MQPEDQYAAFRNFLRKRLPDSETAEDVLQANLLKAMETGEWDEKENPTAWFYKVLRNSVADYYRAKAVRERGDTALESELASTRFDEAELESEACACYKRLLPDLKPEYAEVLKAVDLEGIPPQEAASRFNITYNNLMVRLHRAREALRLRLQIACGLCSKHGCLNCSCQTGAMTG